MQAKQGWNHIAVKLQTWEDKIHQKTPTYTFVQTDEQFILMKSLIWRWIHLHNKAYFQMQYNMVNVNGNQFILM